MFCWRNARLTLANLDVLVPNEAGFSTLNVALNNDIGSITFNEDHLSGIGRVSGVACVNFNVTAFNVEFGFANPPEPDASYLFISDISTDAINVCGIQTDNRVVCWGFSGAVIDVPPEAAFLKQVDVLSGRACGIDLNNTLVCWGNPAVLSTGGDQQFGDVDIATIGPAKQISMEQSGACLIDTSDSLVCFGGMSRYTDFFADQTFANIDIRTEIGPVLCFETTGGEKNCESLSFVENPVSNSQLPADTNARLISFVADACYITIDEVMECTSRGATVTNQFPTAPQNLSVNLFSDTLGEITWTRPSENLFSNDFATGYELFRDGVFIERLPVLSSFIDSDTNPNANYELRATRGLIVGASSFANADGSNGTGLPTPPTTPTTPTEPTAPTTPTIPVDGPSVIELTGAVYSSSALELFYNQSQGGPSAVTYNIFRDGELIRENSPATSQFEAGLDANTTYFYEVTAVVNGDAVATANITLTTQDDGSGAAPTTPVNNPAAPANPTEPTTPSGVTVILSAEVYSSSALELFWNRTSVSGVTYNVFRDGVLIRENSPAISQFEGQLPPNNTFMYEVVALLDGDAVASSTIEINTSSGSASEPVASGPQLPTSGPQQSDVAPIELTGAVFSSSALELSWNRDVIPGVTYDIFRDGELIRENSPAISQFESGLLPNTSYVYTVTPQLNGVEQVSDMVVLSTRSL